MTIKNKKTKQSKEVSSSGTSESRSSSTVQKSSTTSSSVQQSSSSTQKVTSSGKKVRYIEVKVEEEDPLMITDITDHASLSGSTVSEHYNSHPHYIITEAPSVTDLSQTKSSEHHVSDMALSNTGEFVSSSVLQQSSTSHEQSSKSETFQSSSSSFHQSGSSQNQSHEQSINSSTGKLNTGFLETTEDTTGTSFLNRSRGASATDSFLQTERQNLENKSSSYNSSNTVTSNVSESKNISDVKSQNTGKFTQQIKTIPKNTKRGATLKTDSSNFYGGEGNLDDRNKSKQYSSTTQTSESKSSNVTKSSSSSYVVEIVDGKERIIDKSSREWGDAKESQSKEAYASVSGTDIKPESVYSVQNYDMKSKYDTGKDGKPKSEMIVSEDSKLIKDGKEISSHSNINIDTEKLNKRLFYSKDKSSLTDTHENTQTIDTNILQKHSETESESVKTMKDNIKQTHEKLDSSKFYGYDATIDNQLSKVNTLLHVDGKENINFSNKIMKSNTSSAQQASSTSYMFEIVDGKERIVDSSHREWGDSKEQSTYEKSHDISGTNFKPEHKYSRHVIDKESHYDTGKDGIPKSSTQISEESLLMKDGKEIAFTNNKYMGDFTKKPSIREHIDYDEQLINKLNKDTIDLKSSDKSTEYQTHRLTESNVKNTTDFLSKEKQSLTKESISTTDKRITTKDAQTTYEKSTGTWNGKFIYEKDNKAPKRQTEPLFGGSEPSRHHLQRQDTEDNIIISSRDIKDFTSISDLRKIIESTQSKKNVKVNDKSIVINRNINDKVLKDILDTVKKYPFKKIEKVTFGTKINEDVKDLYEGVDTEDVTVLNTANAEIIKKSYEIEKSKSQVEVIRYITENGVTRKIITYEEPKEDEKVKTNVFVDKSSYTDIKNLVSL